MDPRKAYCADCSLVSPHCHFAAEIERLRALSAAPAAEDVRELLAAIDAYLAEPLPDGTLSIGAPLSWLRQGDELLRRCMSALTRLSASEADLRQRHRNELMDEIGLLLATRSCGCYRRIDNAIRASKASGKADIGDR